MALTFFQPPPKKEVMFSVLSVCLSVGLFVRPLDYSKSYERILMNFFGGLSVAQGPSG